MFRPKAHHMANSIDVSLIPVHEVCDSLPVEVGGVEGTGPHPVQGEQHQARVQALQSEQGIRNVMVLLQSLA